MEGVRADAAPTGGNQAKVSVHLFANLLHLTQRLHQIFPTIFVHFRLSRRLPTTRCDFRNPVIKDDAEALTELL